MSEPTTSAPSVHAPDVHPALRRGLTALLLVHTLRCAVAVWLLGPLYRELAQAMDASVFHATASAGDAALALEVIARAWPRTWLRAVVGLGAYALLAPWLQQTVLHALAGESLRAATRRGARVFPYALGIRVTALAAFALIAAGIVLALQAAYCVLPSSVALEAVARWSCVALALCAALWLASAHDLAVAALCHGAPLRACIRAGVTRCSRAALGRHALTIAAATAVVAVGELAGRMSLPLSYALGPALVLALQQCALFAALVIRATWQVRTLNLTDDLAR